MQTPANAAGLKMYLIPCSCGVSFAVAEGYDRQQTSWTNYLICPACGKRHHPHNRVLELGYSRDRYWKVDRC